MSDNPIAKALNEEIGIDLSVKMDDVVAIVSSRKEKEYKAAINELNKKVNHLRREIKDAETGLERAARRTGSQKLKARLANFNFCSEDLGLSAKADLGDCSVVEDDDGNIVHRYWVSMSVKGGYSRAATDSNENRDVLEEGNELRVEYFAIRSMKEELKSVVEELHENQRALNDLGSMERQAKAAIAEASLSNTEAGVEFLDRLGSLDTSYMLGGSND